VAITLCCLPGLDVAWAQDTTAKVANEFSSLLTRLAAITSQQDSLSALADSASGGERQLRHEQIWERQQQAETILLALSDNLRRQESMGRDLSGPRRIVNDLMARGWSRYQALLGSVAVDYDTLRRKRDAASGVERLAIESRMSDLSDRQSVHYRSLVNALLAMDRAGVAVAEPRKAIIARLTSVADLLVTRLRVIERERATVAAQVARASSNQDLRNELSALEERKDRTVDNLALAIELLDRFGVETSGLKVSLITATGRVTADVFNFKVIGGLLTHARKQGLDLLAVHAPRWLFRGLIVVLILAGFKLLASLVQAGVRRAVKKARLSHLLQDTLVAGSAHLVLIIGIIVALAQLGVQLGALVAGLGIAGFVIGFAMQNTLSNFAAGGMILVERPYDIGDEIEAGGATGTVKAMSLVATTILTADNQTLIVPNSKIWGDVIRNITAQSTRRVDLTFSVSYVDDLDKAEQVLTEILATNDKVLKTPQPVVRLHQLADGGVNFIVRPWAQKEHYWTVYWEITRAVKLRFDQEGISIPAARRDLYLHTIPAKDPT